MQICRFKKMSKEEQLTKEYIQNVLARTDNVGKHAVGRALVHLYNRQTTMEQDTLRTQILNERGFTHADAKPGSGMALSYMRYNNLTPAQLAYWQGKSKNGSSRIGKYWRQLLEEAKSKVE